MPSVTVVTSIGIIIISFIGGIIFYYVTNPLLKEAKKKQLEDTLSLLINFIIFIWLGKIIANFSLFIRDPLAVLAYPSDSRAFYIATFLILINVIYRIRRHAFQLPPCVQSFIPVFFAASFIYEFIQMVMRKNAYSWGYLSLLLILIIVYVLLVERHLSEQGNYFLLALWGFGQLTLSIVLPYTTVFGYMIAPWFFLSIFILSLIMYVYSRKRKVL